MDKNYINTDEIMVYREDETHVRFVSKSESFYPYYVQSILEDRIIDIIFLTETQANILNRINAQYGVLRFIRKE